MSPFEFIASSHLISAAVAASSGLMLFAIISREGRVRPDGVLNKEHVIAILFAPLITVLMSASAIFTIFTLRTLGTQPPSVQDWAVAGGAALLTVIVWTLAAPARGAGNSTNRRGSRRPLVASPDAATS